VNKESWRSSFYLGLLGSIEGERMPVDFGYYYCSECGSRLKFQSGKWSEVDDQEWQEFAISEKISLPNLPLVSSP
jgi:hypothetical protein